MIPPVGYTQCRLQHFQGANKSFDLFIMPISHIWGCWAVGGPENGDIRSFDVLGETTHRLMILTNLEVVSERYFNVGKTIP